MDPGFAESSGNPNLRRIDPPGRLLLAVLLVGEHQELLQVLDDHLADRSNLTCLAELTRMANERMACVVVGECQDQPGSLHNPHERPGLVQRVGERLVADNVAAGLQKGTGNREVRDRRGDDGNEIDAATRWQPGLCGGHLVEAIIASGRIEIELAAGLSRVVRVPRKAACNQLDLLVERGRHAMDSSDEGPLSPADHAHPELAFPGFHDDSSRDQESPRMARLRAASNCPPAKSSNATVVASIRCRSMNGAPSRAPCSGLLTQHSHSRTAQPR